jgi:hypothetical protein
VEKSRVSERLLGTQALGFGSGLFGGPAGLLKFEVEIAGELEKGTR